MIPLITQQQEQHITTWLVRTMTQQHKTVLFECNSGGVMRLCYEYVHVMFLSTRVTLLSGPSVSVLYVCPKL